jgi:hypothetical protein
MSVLNAGEQDDCGGDLPPFGAETNKTSEGAEKLGERCKDAHLDFVW